MTQRGSVRVDSLAVADFRNLDRAFLEPGPRFNVLCGDNGAGKTNLLEAIYLLGALRSFRTTTRGELVRRGAEAARVAADFGDATAGLRCELCVEAASRRVRINGVAIRPGGSHFRELPMVLFHPGHVELVRGGPEHRRRFLDRALFQDDARYPALHRDYRRALESRNHLLRARSLDTRSLALFESQLAASGAKLIELRRDFLERLSPLFAKAAGRIGRGQGAAVRYRPSIDAAGEGLMISWERSRDRDRALGHTAAGPHTDDLVLELDGRAARRDASQGQQRTLALSLKVAETRVLEEATGRIPLMLLDDVSSELDRERNRRLFELLEEGGGQVFVTSTRGDHIVAGEARRDFLVEDGRVTAC